MADHPKDPDVVAGSATEVTDISDYVIEGLQKAGVSDYCFGVSIGGKREFVSSGERCSEQKASNSPPEGFATSCLIKPFLALTALGLEQRGDVDLGAPIETYLKEFRGRTKGRLIQLKHLMNHSAGYDAFAVPAPIFTSAKHPTRRLQRILDAQEIFWPGHVFSYDLSVTSVLGEIVSRVAGRGSKELIQKVIFERLGLSARSSIYRKADHATSRREVAPNRESRWYRFPKLGISIVDAITLSEELMSSISGTFADGSSARMHGEIVDIPRSANSSAARYLPIGCSIVAEKFQNGFFGFDGRSENQVIGIRYSPILKVGFALGINSNLAVARRELFGDIVARFQQAALVGAGTRVGESEYDSFEVRELCGTYSGCQAFQVAVEAKGRDIVVYIQSRSRKMMTRGTVSASGKVLFQREFPGSEPCFFRYQRTGEPCVMLGMYALKKMPVVNANRLG